MTTQQKLELTRRIGLFGLSDLRKIAPIGNIGWVNFMRPGLPWMRGGLETAIYDALMKQRKRIVGFERECGRCMYTTEFPEIGLTASIDSSG